MHVVRTIPELNASLREQRSQDASIGFVPTMGALHEGHLSLSRASTHSNDVTVMSIFVNPTQFGPKEDFEKYPRQFEEDSNAAKAAGVDRLFCPAPEVIYPKGFTTYVEETELSNVLCGEYRPGHFRGVCTVVLKLFQMVRPTRAYFGQKDAQQLRVIEKMVEDLNVPIDIVGCPTVREPDGLALSSRNKYLSASEREYAPIIYRALSEAHTCFQNGERNRQKIVETARAILQTKNQFKLQYLELRRWRDFAETEQVEEKSILAIALHLGQTRLIDNVVLEP